MDTPVSLNGLATISHPSVLIIEPHLTPVSALHEWREAMPDIAFDVCTSGAVGLSKVRQGDYHTVISDPTLIETDHYSFLKDTLRLSCPVPVLISAKTGDFARVGQALNEGALDVIPCPARGRQASSIIRSALWLYRLRLTMYERRRRLQALLERRVGQSALVSSRTASALLEQTIRDIQDTNARFDRTIQQIESSLRVLEDSSHRIESQTREIARGMIRLMSHS
jgi:DNA-binding NtrC family response regulator